MTKNTLKGYGFAVLSAVIYGTMPLMAKHIYADGVNAMTLVFLRNILALPSLAPLALLKQKTLRISPKELGSVCLISLFGCCGTSMLLFSSYSYIPTGTATVFHFIYPSVVVLIGMVFLKRRVPRSTLLGIALCFAGICLFYDPAAPFHPKGGALALTSGLTFAIYVVLLSRFKSDKVSGFLLCFHIAAVSSVFSLLLCLASRSLALPTTAGGWALCLFFAFLITTGAVLLFQQATFLIGGEKASILSALEPTTSVILGAAVFGESLALRVLLGSALVVAASICIAVSDMRKKEAVSCPKNVI